jgi:hypothetical protein
MQFLLNFNVRYFNGNENVTVKKRAPDKGLEPLTLRYLEQSLLKV